MPMYNCTADVMAHKRKVRALVWAMIHGLIEAAALHDDSKLAEPEKSMFDRTTPLLQAAEFGSEAYKAALAGMGEGLAHHYATNSHHPEHFEDGIAGMTLIDLVEMVCDWMAAAQVKGNPVNLDYLVQRFGISEQLAHILANTLQMWED
jgi:hypothetical protein